MPTPTHARSLPPATPAHAHTIITDLNTQWTRLNTGHEQAPQVAASLDAWRRHCPDLTTINTLNDALWAIEVNDDQVLACLITAGLNGDTIAIRTVVQAFLPRVIRLATGSTDPFTDAVLDGVEALWDLVATYPLARRPKIRANLAMDLLKVMRRRAVVREFPHDPRDRSVFEVPAAEHSPTADTVLGRARGLGLLTDEEAWMLDQVYVADVDRQEVADRLGISNACLRQRCSRAVARLREHAAELA